MRQKQLQKRVSIAREVAKDQNITLVKPEVPEEEKWRVLKFVSYHVSKKLKHLDDVVLHAMGDTADSCKFRPATEPKRKVAKS